MRHNLQLDDVVLIHVREKPAFYAQVEAIEPDVKRGWHRLTLRSFLGKLEWILEDVHIFLGQTWTFGGIPHRMERIGKRRTEYRRKSKLIPLKRIE